jgi:hypothetical protein
MHHRMKLKPGTLFPAMLLISLFFITSPAFAQSDGDVLQLQTYIVESAADRPDVTDGQIAAATNLDEWKSASARNVTCEKSGGATKSPTFFFANDNDSLYIAVAITTTDNGAGQGFFLYFDLDNDGVLDGTPAQPGEYAISAVKNDATSGTVREYGWNGTAWVQNTIPTPGLKQGFEDNGAGGSHVFNYELQIPFLSSAPNAGQAFLNTAPGQEVGAMIHLDLFDGDFYWQTAGTSVTNASAWGELLINTALGSPRRMASLYAKSYVPTVTDGNITDDVNWKYSFDKTVVFTDFAGHKLSNCRILIKESGTNLYFGARITDNVSNNGDYFQIYFDQGNSGGALNYVMNTTSTANQDDAIRVAGDDTRTDWYFGGKTEPPPTIPAPQGS